MAEAPTYPLPTQTELVAIEAPLAIRHVDRAIALLGGLETLGKQYSERAPIELRLHAGPHARPAYAGLEAKPSLLLRVDARTKEARIEGICADMYQFKGIRAASAAGVFPAVNAKQESGSLIGWGGH